MPYVKAAFKLLIMKYITRDKFGITLKLTKKEYLCIRELAEQEKKKQEDLGEVISPSNVNHFCTEPAIEKYIEEIKL